MVLGQVLKVIRKFQIILTILGLPVNGATGSTGQPWSYMDNSKRFVMHR
jgi:hypothetical protein